MSPPGTPGEPTSERAEVVAFYHPTHAHTAGGHPLVSDWQGVRHAAPLFEGHRQPRLAGELDYYDTADPQTHAAQQELARRYGVSAFCHLAVWQGGRPALRAPLDVLAAHPDLTLPFCLRWDGERRSAPTGGEVVSQLATLLADPRYLRVDGAAVLLVDLRAVDGDPVRTCDALRARADALGLGALHLALAQQPGAWDPRVLGFDAAVEIPPRGADRRLCQTAAGGALDPVGAGDPKPGRALVASYPALAEWSLSQPVPDFTWHRGVAAGWDDTPRLGEQAWVLRGESPDLFQTWLERALHHTYLFTPAGRRMLFVTAWNDWASGAYLEPDLEHGHALLAAVSRALAHTCGLAAEITAAQRSGRGSSPDPGLRSGRGSGPGPGSGLGSDLVDLARAYVRSTAILTREALVLRADAEGW